MTPFVVLITPNADKQALAVDLWWRANRTAAPELFREEFSRVRGLLSSAPLAFPRVGSPRGTRRRLLLPRSRFHVYYRCLPRRRLVIVDAVWSAVRGRGPGRGRR